MSYGDFISVELISPEGIVFSTKARAVYLEGEEGNFGVLPGHVASIFSLSEGIARIDSSEGLFKYFVKGGVAKIDADKVIIATELAEDFSKSEQKEIEAKLASYRK